jgi:hypothetical protein
MPEPIARVFHSAEPLCFLSMTQLPKACPIRGCNQFTYTNFKLSVKKTEEIMHEYAFDVKLVAVVRVSAVDRETAEAVLSNCLDCVDLNFTISDKHGNAKVTEASIEADDADYPRLFEFDGENVEFDE